MFSVTESDEGMVLKAVVACCCVEGGIVFVNCMSEIGSPITLLLRTVTMMVRVDAVEFFYYL